MENYQVEFSDEKSREEMDMPFNRVIKAKNKREAIKKFKRQIGARRIKSKKIKVEAVFKLRKKGKKR